MEKLQLILVLQRQLKIILQLQIKKLDIVDAAKKNKVILLLMLSEANKDSFLRAIRYERCCVIRSLLPMIRILNNNSKMLIEQYNRCVHRYRGIDHNRSE